MQGERKQDKTVAGQIARALANRIVSGEIPANTRLMQDHIASEFGASHVPVREAFRRLEARGLVVSEPRRGVRVAPLDVKAITEVSEMRAALEALALNYAMKKMSKENISLAQKSMDDDKRTAKDDFLALQALNTQFHRAITTPCGMPLLLGTIEQLQEVSSRNLLSMWGKLPAWQKRSTAEHNSILTAIKGGRTEEACTLLRLHILEGGKALAEAAALTGDR